jgi:putative Mg2+ transporter-C (MgtC) family protein
MQSHTIVLHLLLALALGTAIGFERQWNHKVAGLRTNALVALGAAGFVMLSLLIGPPDPTRIAAQVVSGIGFLGAGVIIREGVNVHGLTTAATLWCSAMVGTLAGAGFPMPAIIAATLVVAINIALRPIVRVLVRREVTNTDVETAYSLHVTVKPDDVKAMRANLLDRLTKAGFSPRQVKSEMIGGTDLNRIVIRMIAAQRSGETLERIAGDLSDNAQITSVIWRSMRANPDV